MVDPTLPLGMKLSQNATVVSVTPTGQAEGCGVRPGDIVVGLGAVRISSRRDFDSAIKLYRAAGDVISLTTVSAQKSK